MKNYVADGNTLPYTVAGTSIASGEARLIGTGGQVCIATIDGEVGDEVPMLRCGVVSYAKQAALAIAIGVKVYHDSAADEVDVTNTNNFMGYAYTAAASGDATVAVVLAPPGS